MKNTGIVRQVDELGRVVLPKELRRTLGINLKDPMEIFVDEETIILQKYNSNMACAFTKEVSHKNRAFINGKLVLSLSGAELLIKEIESKFL